MARITVFLKSNRPHQAVIEDLPLDEEVRINIVDAVGAFIDGKTKTLAMTAEHRVEIVR